MTAAEYANAGMETAKRRKLDEAKALLEAEGYKISASPAVWKDYSCVVTLRVQSHDFNSREFKQIIESIVRAAIPDTPRLQKLTTKHVVGMSNFKFGMKHPDTVIEGLDV